MTHGRDTSFIPIFSDLGLQTFREATPHRTSPTGGNPKPTAGRVVFEQKKKEEGCVSDRKMLWFAHLKWSMRPGLHTLNGQ